MKYIKVSRRIDTQVYHNHIPVNAIYGRISSTIYFYVDDLKQFVSRENSWKVYILDTKTRHGRFTPQIQRVGNSLYNEIVTFIRDNNIDVLNTKCQYHTGHYARPDRKKSQSETGFIYKCVGNPSKKSYEERTRVTDHSCSKHRPFSDFSVVRANSEKTKKVFGEYHDFSVYSQYAK